MRFRAGYALWVLVAFAATVAVGEHTFSAAGGGGALLIAEHLYTLKFVWYSVFRRHSLWWHSTVRQSRTLLCADQILHGLNWLAVKATDAEEVSTVLHHGDALKKGLANRRMLGKLRLLQQPSSSNVSVVLDHHVTAASPNHCSSMLAGCWGAA